MLYMYMYSIYSILYTVYLYGICDVIDTQSWFTRNPKRKTYSVFRHLPKFSSSLVCMRKFFISSPWLGFVDVALPSWRTNGMPGMKEKIKTEIQEEEWMVANLIRRGTEWIEYKKMKKIL